MWTLELYDPQATTPAWYTDTYTDGADVKFPSSTSTLSLGTKSNSQYIVLVDGSEALLQRATSYLHSDLKFSASPLVVTDEMITKFNEYIEDNIGLRITTHTGDIIEGYIINIAKTYEMTGQTQLYTLDINFKRFDVDSSGGY